MMERSSNDRFGGGVCTHEYEKKKKKIPGKRKEDNRVERRESNQNSIDPHLTSVRFNALKKTSTSYKAIKKKKNDDDDVLFVLFVAA